MTFQFQGFYYGLPPFINWTRDGDLIERYENAGWVEHKVTSNTPSPTFYRGYHWRFKARCSPIFVDEIRVGDHILSKTGVPYSILTMQYSNTTWDWTIEVADGNGRTETWTVSNSLIMFEVRNRVDVVYESTGYIPGAPDNAVLTSAPVGYTPVHSVQLKRSEAPEIEAGKAEIEKWVRRNTRSWPMYKKLVFSVQDGMLDGYWVDSE